MLLKKIRFLFLSKDDQFNAAMDIAWEYIEVIYLLGKWAETPIHVGSAFDLYEAEYNSRGLLEFYCRRSKAGIDYDKMIDIAEAKRKLQQ